MNFKISQNLASKIKSQGLGSSNVEVGPNIEWHGRLFYANSKTFIITVESYSLFTVIIEAKGINSLEEYVDSFTIAMLDILKMYDGKSVAHEILTSRLDGINFYKGNDKTFIAYLNNFVYHSKWNLEKRKNDTIKASNDINFMPVNNKDMWVPMEKILNKKIPYDYRSI
jgi:phage-related protein